MPDQEVTLNAQKHRIIMHIDMNAFFASVEQAAKPELRGRPIAVTGGGNRTVITTASYEARKYGVRTGMNVPEAKRYCRHLIVVVGNNREYARISKEIIRLLRDFTPLVEVFSIDEAFMDITGCMKLFGSAERIALTLKQRIRENFNLTCSIGIAPNKLLAKLASDMQKPDGLTVIPPERVTEVLERVPVKDLCGIGKKTQQQLESFGIRTCGELGRFPVEVLTKRFGVVGQHLHDMACGIDDSPVIPDEEAEAVKSVGHSTTFDRDITCNDDILRHLLELSEMVGARARKYGVRGKTVGVTVRYADFATFTRQETLSCAINLTDDIYTAARRIMEGITLTQPVRLLGVRIVNLCTEGDQLPLFGGNGKKSLATEAMDNLNGRFGKWTVTYGTLLDEEEKGASVLSPAWRPEGIRNVDVK